MPSTRPSDTDQRALRAALVTAGRRLGARGLIAAGEGNLSVRLGEQLLITPSGRRKDELSRATSWSCRSSIRDSPRCSPWPAA